MQLEKILHTLLIFNKFSLQYFLCASYEARCCEKNGLY